MPSYEQLSELLDPPPRCLLTVEWPAGCRGPGQRAAPNSPRRRGRRGAGRTSRGCGRRAREWGEVIHAVAEAPPRRPGANRTPGCSARAERLPVRQLTVTTAVRIVPPIEVAEEDFVVRRLHGLSPDHGHRRRRTAAQPGLPHPRRDRRLGHVAIPNAVFRRGEPAATPPWCPRTPSRGALRLHDCDDPQHARLIATIASTRGVLACFKRPRRGPTGVTTP